MSVRKQETWWESITVWVQEFIPGGKAVEAGIVNEWNRLIAHKKCEYTISLVVRGPLIW